jgi:hypothetical protein
MTTVRITRAVVSRFEIAETYAVGNQAKKPNRVRPGMADAGVSPINLENEKSRKSRAYEDLSRDSNELQSVYD